MTLRLLAISFALSLTSCGKPAIQSEVPRPDQVLDFPTLYAENCSACHGLNGRNGAAISLANPVYLAAAGAANIQRVTAEGVTGTSMPPFAIKSGGTLTDQQIAALTSGMIAAWGKPSTFVPVPYINSAPGDPEDGKQAFATACTHCHPNGTLNDPDYLSLISDQGLRSFIIAGHTGNPALNNKQVTDIVAWLASQRRGTQ
jgi:cytochrome c oxidase cbb3-type subunit 3/ubiquinol-cytochrome c reductase cytochrome c subunit